ncbi:archaemetzincin-2 isoform X1 [Oncorhynchus kisutch]|uniref:archaemetzincin-2 isoform X1 n=1 Tax=Oncorhynchus kisutch TaxID=8019 RepID=UPI0012DF9E49|nr:archaemetzincin-2 isoform X1 [Oncorhynchus kisutch]
MGPCSGPSLCTLTRTGSTRTQRSRRTSRVSIATPTAANPSRVTVLSTYRSSAPLGRQRTGRYVRWLRDYCQAFYYWLVVKLLPPVTVAATDCAFRVNSSSHNLQIHAGDLLRFLQKRKPYDAFGIMGITVIDLYPKDSWNFVFGRASLTEGMGVFSFARYDDNFYIRSYVYQALSGRLLCV